MDRSPGAERRVRLTEAMISDSWRIAEAARASLPGAPSSPPWIRGRDADAVAHRRMQRRLRQLHERIDRD